MAAHAQKSGLGDRHYVNPGSSHQQRIDNLDEEKRQLKTQCYEQLNLSANKHKKAEEARAAAAAAAATAAEKTQTSGLQHKSAMD